MVALFILEIGLWQSIIAQVAGGGGMQAAWLQSHACFSLAGWLTVVKKAIKRLCIFGM
jgi:hypothetical protein